MKERTCDCCHKTIPKKTDYYSASKILHLKHTIKYQHQLDICQECINKLHNLQRKCLTTETIHIQETRLK